MFNQNISSPLKSASHHPKHPSRRGRTATLLCKGSAARTHRSLNGEHGSRSLVDAQGKRKASSDHGLGSTRLQQPHRDAGAIISSKKVTLQWNRQHCAVRVAWEPLSSASWYKWGLMTTVTFLSEMEPIPPILP